MFSAAAFPFTPRGKSSPPRTLRGPPSSREAAKFVRALPAGETAPNRAARPHVSSCRPVPTVSVLGLSPGAQGLTGSRSGAMAPPPRSAPGAPPTVASAVDFGGDWRKKKPPREGEERCDNCRGWRLPRGGLRTCACLSAARRSCGSRRAPPHPPSAPPRRARSTA